MRTGRPGSGWQRAERVSCRCQRRTLGTAIIRERAPKALPTCGARAYASSKLLKRRMGANFVKYAMPAACGRGESIVTYRFFDPTFGTRLRDAAFVLRFGFPLQPCVR